MLRDNIKIIGHRGAAGHYTENTLQSILTAIMMGVDCIEIDVWTTADNEIIVFHDEFLDRLTTSKGFIQNFTLAQVKDIQLRDGNAIPTLEEVVLLIKKHKVQLLVELKSENCCDRVVQILEKELEKDQYIVGSFFHKQIMDLKFNNPQIQTSIMLECGLVNLDEYLLLINPDYVVLSIETINQEMVNIIRNQKRKLLLYTVNTEPEIQKATSLAPYGIISNYPDRFTVKHF